MQRIRTWPDSRVALATAASCAVAALLASCGGGSKSEPDPPACVGIQVGDICRPPDLNASALGTDWHPDPDGDGVATEDDLCPYVYDPAQADSDGDGVGDMCDDDATTFEEDGPIRDLRAEHVTPYGGWFSFTSVSSTEYGWHVVLAWSTNRADLESDTAIAALPEAQKDVQRIHEYARTRLRRPMIVTSMEPGTRYYITARSISGDEVSTKAGRVLEITTAAAPRPNLGASHPRAWASAEDFATLRQRFQNGDTRLISAEETQGAEALQVASSSERYVFGYCLSAALLYRATDDARYRDAALSLIDNMRQYWDDRDLEANALRWVNASLGACADLMWDELTADQRNAVVAAYLQDDELADAGRLDDTDEFSSIARTWIADGLVACEAPGLSGDLSRRACDLLDRGLRLFYGVQVVKAKRDRGFFAQSGGNLPDGIGYARGTSSYWLHTLHTLSNAGVPVTEFAPWVWNNLRAIELYAITPSQRGYATFGDLDSYNNFDVEPNSIQVDEEQASLVAFRMGLLERAGFPTEAGYARYRLDAVYKRDRSNRGWALVLFDHDGIAAEDFRSKLDTAYYDSGMGMLYDRSSWGTDASYLVFHSGWSGVDHAHEDVGSFQLYRSGVWITHEALGYDGDAAEAVGHNVMALDVPFGDGEMRFGQYRAGANGNARVQRVSSTADYTYVSANQTGAYNAPRYGSFGYDAVERQLLWLKPATPGGPERVVVYDLVDSSAASTSARRHMQLHLDKAPAISGTTATLTDAAGSDVQIDVVVPASASLTVHDPAGEPNNFPGEVYNYRLVADPHTDDPNLRFVTLLRASTGDAPALTRGVESADAVGVLTGSDLVVFPRSHGPVQATGASVAIDTSTAVSVWWAGLQPSTSYELTTTYDGTTLTITVRPGDGVETDAAGLLVTRAELP